MSDIDILHSIRNAVIDYYLLGTGDQIAHVHIYAAMDVRHMINILLDKASCSN